MGYSRNDKIIVKGIGGFYYVKTADGVIEAKAKGIFRKRGITPLAGDIVDLEKSGGDYVISEIKERKNCFLRPPAANIDLMFLVVSAVDPIPNLLVVDKLLAIAQSKVVKTVILLTKTDLAKGSEFAEIYQSAGFRVIDIRADLDTAGKDIKKLAYRKHSVFIGNSGVGKSTLLNDLFDFKLQTAQTSKKLGRGRHTTRAVELFEAVNGYVTDTPGFSAVDIEHAEYIPYDDFQYLFADIAPYVGKCRYRGCSHMSENDCAVTEAAQAGRIQKSRYDSYCALYKKAKEIYERDVRTKTMKT